MEKQFGKMKSSLVPDPPNRVVTEKESSDNKRGDVRIDKSYQGVDGVDAGVESIALFPDCGASIIEAGEFRSD